MALTIEERTKIWRGMMRVASNYPDDFPVGDIVKDDLYDPDTDTGAIADLDDWIGANQAAINNSLNEAFRTGASAEFKTLLLCAITTMRVSVDFAKLVLGNMD